jgi:hypothetical protein
MRAVRGAPLLALLLAQLAWTVLPAQAAQSVRLRAALMPEHLGAGTTIEFGFRIATPNHRVPPPLTAIDLLYPANIGIVTSGLGLATCSPTTLEAIGPEGCPPDSLMGHGSALVEIPIGPEIIEETGRITTWMAPVQNGHLALLFYAEGEDPVSAQLIFTSLLLEAPAPFGGNLHTQIPVIPGLPETPDAAVVQMRSTIGPMNITYFQHSHHKTIAYQPNGLLLPNSCPHGGFPFAATFAFLDGTHTTAHTTVPCPR